MNEPLAPSVVLSYLRERLELDEQLTDLWLVGEVANYSRSQQGHRYFTLKDDYASLRCVLFRTEMPGVELEPGEMLITHGRIGIYPQRGELQYVCDFVRSAGAGILAARFEELKARLEREGLFEPSRKRPLPPYPRKIGIVTSPTGAAIEDIQRVVARRWPLAELVLAPTPVQGEAAAPRIVGALADLAMEPDLDVAILARGGGSAEDLWAFNDERVARAVYRFPVPLVTGVGHATDTTIVDFVADAALPTPSAAAERCVPDRIALAAAIAERQRATGGHLRRRLAGEAEAVSRTMRRLRRCGPRPAERLVEMARLLGSMQSATVRVATERRAKLDAMSRRLEDLNPYATLARGFAIVQDARTRKVIASTKKVKPGHRLSVAVKDGAFWVEVS